MSEKNEKTFLDIQDKPVNELTSKEKKELARRMYMGGMKGVDIAHKLQVADSTIRRWKCIERWGNSERDEKYIKELEANGIQIVKDSLLKDKYIKLNDNVDCTTQQLMRNEDLTHKQRLFCLYYSRTYNATQSYQKAFGCSYEVALSNAHKLWNQPKIKEEVYKLMDVKRQQIFATEVDVVEMHMRIAFADMKDYVTVKKGQIFINDSENFDGQLIQKVQKGKNGVSIELADRQKSLEWLDKFFMMNPFHKLKAEYEELKITGEIERQKQELESTATVSAYNGIPFNAIAPKYMEMLYDIESDSFHEFCLSGGRGSAKSSAISLTMIDLIEKNADMHAVIYRQVKDTLRDSVYKQMIWAINTLKLTNEYDFSISPMVITKKSTGQTILFRGNDDASKSKGITTTFGYVGILWFEELDQFKGEQAVRTVRQSVIRGGDKSFVFYSFNPPKSKNNWANIFVEQPKKTMKCIKSTYLDIPKHWLGKDFIAEAEYQKEVNPTAYENEYMGIPNGSGGNIFDNVVVREITDEEIRGFDNIYNGVDWGWYPDLYAFGRCHYEPSQATLYIFCEYTGNKLSNEETSRYIMEDIGLDSEDLITCDNSENKSIGYYNSVGLYAKPTFKNAESRRYSYKWLQQLKAIVIDKERCPVAEQEFRNKEYERDKDGNVVTGYPDGDDHMIDCIRYAMTSVWRRKGE